MQTLTLVNSQKLARGADCWFADRTLALCFKSWSDFTLQRRLHKQQRQEAEGYNQFVNTFTSALSFFFFFMIVDHSGLDAHPDLSLLSLKFLVIHEVWMH